MTDEIAKLTVSVDSTSAKAATNDLDKLAAAGQRAQGSTDALGAASKAASSGLSDVHAAARRYSQQMTELADRERDRAITLARRAAAEKAAAEATAKAAKEAEKAAGAHKGLSLASGQVVREYAVLVNELQRGDFTRFQGSLITLANRMNVTQLAFTAAGAAALGFGAILVGTTVLVAQGAMEQDKYNKLLQATGNFAATSADEIRMYANEMVNAHTSIGEANEALGLLIKSGRVSRDALQEAARGATDMANLLGISVEDAVQKFVRIRDEPVRAAQELDKQLNFLTTAEYAHIRALEDAGKVQEAADATQHALAKSMADRTHEVEEHAGTLIRTAKTVSEWWNKAWRDVTEGVKSIGREQSPEEAIREKLRTNARVLQTMADAFRKDEFQFGPKPTEASRNAAIAERVKITQSLVAQLNELGNAQKKAAENAETERAGKVALDRARELTDQYGRAERRQRLLNELAQTYSNILKGWKLSGGAKPEILEGVQFDEQGNPIGGGAFAEARKGIIHRTQEFQTRKPARSPEEREAARALREQEAEYERLSRQINEHQNILDETRTSEDKLTTVQKFATTVLGNFAAGHTKLSLAQQETLAKQIEQLKVTDAENTARMTANQLIEQRLRLEEKWAGMAEGRARDAERELLAMANGGETMRMIARQDDIRDRAAQDRYELNKKARRENAVGTQEYLDALETINRAEAEALKNEEGYYQRRKEVMGDWRNGAKRAMDEIREESEDVAGQTYKGWKNAFETMNTAIDAWANGAKVKFKDVAKAILAELLKVEARILVSNILTSLFAGATGGASGTAAAPVSGGSAAGVAGGGGWAISKALGGVFLAGRELTTMAKGGVVTGSTLMPMANGRALIGEAGPEGVLPLRRNSNGQLGVIAQGGGGGGDTNVNIQVNVNQDGSTSSRMNGDGDEMNGKRLAEAIDTRIRQVLNEEKRQGGSLWAMQNGR